MSQPAPTSVPLQTARPRVRQRLLARYGPWAVVTGASSGIGLALAEELAASGFSLVLLARDAEALEAAAANLTAAHGTTSRVLPLDLTSPHATDRLLDATADLEVGLLVAAAGFGTSGPFLEADLDAELAMLAVNCGAVVAATLGYARRFDQAQLAGTREGRRAGGIVLLASLVGRQGTPWAAHYAATKAHVLTLAEGLHRELAPRGIDVLGAAPGPVHSGFADRAGMTMSAAATPAQIAAPVLAALGRRVTVVPGGLAKALTWSLAPLPRAGRSRIMAQVMRSMTEDVDRPPRS